MKKTIIAVVVIAICILGLPPLLGMRAESIVSDNINANQNAIFSLAVDSYDRGWFSSTARISLSLSDQYRSQLASMAQLQGGGVPPELLDASAYFLLDLHHGPVVMMDGLYFGLARFNAGLDSAEQWVSDVQTMFAIDHVVQYRGRIGYTGAYNYDADIPGFDYTNELVQVSFSGATMEGEISGGVGNHEGLIESVSADILGMQNLTLDTLRFTATDIVTINDAFSTCDVNMSLKSVRGGPIGGGSPALSVAALSIDFTMVADESAGTLDNKVLMSADQFMIQDQIDITDLQLGINLENLSIEAWSGLAETTTTLDTTALMQGMIPQFLATNPSVSIDPFSARYNNEPLEGRMTLTYASDDPNVASMVMLNPLLAMQAIEANLDLRASKALVNEIVTMVMKQQLEAALSGQQLPPGQDIDTMAAQQVPMMIDMVVAQGMVIEEADAYSTNISFAGGELLVNGSPMQLPL